MFKISQNFPSHALSKLLSFLCRAHFWENQINTYWAKKMRKNWVFSVHFFVGGNMCTCHPFSYINRPKKILPHTNNNNKTVIPFYISYHHNKWIYLQYFSLSNVCRFFPLSMKFTISLSFSHSLTLIPFLCFFLLSLAHSLSTLRWWEQFHMCAICTARPYVCCCCCWSSRESGRGWVQKYNALHIKENEGWSVEWKNSQASSTLIWNYFNVWIVTL
jgi:hypothetical protein